MRAPAAPLPGRRPWPARSRPAPSPAALVMLARQGAAAVSSQDVIYRLEAYGRRPRDPPPTVQEAAHQPKVSGEPPWGPASKPLGLG
jgi:hypothetical protein